MNAIIKQRNFDVAVDVLFKAFSQPEHLKEWWGPNDFTNTFYEFNFCNGGKWRFTMHGPDGKGYENESEFETVKENELIVLRHISKPEYKATFSFSSINSNASVLVWEMIFETEKAYEALKEIVAEKNEENLNRLEKEVEKIK
jgi:uncharacterized protein YndB with AHSA1/START domain